jgi:nucleoside-diphosphate-sugar epimerase
MNQSTELQVVLGTGQLGQSVMRELVQRGACVRMVSRSGKLPGPLPAGVELMPADLYQPDEVRRVIQGAAVIYHTAQPPYHQWPEKFPALQESIITGVTGSPARMIMGDNLYMYGPVDGPIVETLPYSARTRKGSTRAKIAAALLDAHRKGNLRTAIGRASDFFGPGVLGSAVGESFFGPLAQGKAANVLGHPDMPHTYTFIQDFGKALVVLGEHDEALGQVWHVPNAEPVTSRQLVAMAAEALGVKPRMLVVRPWMARFLGLFVPEIREMIEMEYEFTRPFIVDYRKYKQAFGDHSTPLREALRQTAEWFKMNLK